jgi:hypothetical protein
VRVTITASVLALALLETVAIAGDAAERRVQGWIHKLKTDPVAARRKLIREIRDEANQYDDREGVDLPTTTDRADLLPALEVALSDEDDDVRSDAIGALKYMRHPKAFPILARAVDSPHWSVRYFATEAIGWLGDIADLRSSVVAVLVKVRDREEKEDIDIPLAAAQQLVRLGVKTDPRIFIDSLKREDPTCTGAEALMKLGRRDTIELMVKAIGRAVPSRDYWIGKYLQKLTGQVIGGDNPGAKDAAAWQEWLDANRSKLPEQVR